MGYRWYIPWYQRGILSCRETLWELGNWIKWKSKILPEYALCRYWKGVMMEAGVKYCSEWESLGCFMWTINVCLERGNFAGVSSFLWLSLHLSCSSSFLNLKKWDLHIDRHSFSSALWKESLNPKYFVCFMKVVSLAGDWRGSVWEDAAGGPAGDAQATNHFKKDFRSYF